MEATGSLVEYMARLRIVGYVSLVPCLRDVTSPGCQSHALTDKSGEGGRIRGLQLGRAKAST